MMRAYVVFPRDLYEASGITAAETPGRARYLAHLSAADAGYDHWRITDFRVLRLPPFDEWAARVGNDQGSARAVACGPFNPDMFENGRAVVDAVLASRGIIA